MQSVSITTYIVSLNLAHGEVYCSYNIMFVSDLWQVGGFSVGTSVSSTNKTDRHDIVEIFLKLALNTINPKPNPITLIQETSRQVNCIKKKYLFIIIQHINTAR